MRGLWKPALLGAALLLPAFTMAEAHPAGHHGKHVGQQAHYGHHKGDHRKAFKSFRRHDGAGYHRHHGKRYDYDRGYHRGGKAFRKGYRKGIRDARRHHRLHKKHGLYYRIPGYKHHFGRPHFVPPVHYAPRHRHYNPRLGTWFWCNLRH